MVALRITRGDTELSADKVNELVFSLSRDGQLSLRARSDPRVHEIESQTGETVFEVDNG